MISRRQFQEILEATLDWQPIRYAQYGISGLARMRWRNKLAALGRIYLNSGINFVRNTSLKVPAEYRRQVRGPDNRNTPPGILGDRCPSLAPSRREITRPVHPKRKRALFRGVMSGLREYYYPWSEFTGRSIPWVDIFQAAGATVRPVQDKKADLLAVSTWNRRPTIEIHGELWEKGWIEHALLHELFHLTAPYGEGKHYEHLNHVTEVLASRFARELLCPLPVTAHHAAHSSLSHFASLTHAGVHLQNVLRIVDRPGFTLELALHNDWATEKVWAGGVVAQCGSPVGEHRHSLDELVSLARMGDPDTVTDVAWCMPHNAAVTCLTRDGLYRFADDSGATWSLIWEKLLGGSGILDDVETRPGHVGSFSRELREIGATYVVHSLESSLIHDQMREQSETDHRYAPKPEQERLEKRFDSVPVRSVIIFPDDDGSLTDNLNRGRYPGGQISILPPDDPLIYSQPETFEEWVYILERVFFDGLPKTPLSAFLNSSRRLNPFFMP